MATDTIAAAAEPSAAHRAQFIQSTGGVGMGRSPWEYHPLCHNDFDERFMQIYLLRHGIAEDAAPGGSDAARRLTPEGKKRLNAVLRRAAKSGVEPTLILSSPLVRAVQTAEMAAQALGYSEKVVITKALEPDREPEEVWTELRMHRSEPQVLLVGHEPLFGRLAAYLLNARSLQTDFKKGALLRVDCESLGPNPRGVLKWLLAPRLA